MGCERQSIRKGSLPSKALLVEGFFDYVLNPIPGICPVKYCTRSSKGDRALCSCHDMQRWRATHPGTAGYHALRSHATARGIKFTVSYEEYVGTLKTFDHTKPVLRHGDHLSIDRVNPALGYVPGNIQAITVSENVRKQNRERYLPEGRYYRGMEEQAETAAAEEAEEAEEDEVPF